VVPKIAKAGTSFKGAFAYYCHDKNADTAERVGFFQTLNMRTDDPEKAWRVMAFTALNQDRIKNDFGTASTGKTSNKVVYAYSLSWAEDETPTKAAMMQAATASLKALGAEDYQTAIVSHTDEPHPHIHVIVNRVHPEHGKLLDIYQDRTKLSDFALEYERTQGKIRCRKRAENSRKREEGQKIKYRNEEINASWNRAENGKQFATHLKRAGLVLARGDKRGFVIVDQWGKVLNPTRQIEGENGRNIRAAELRDKLKDLDPAKLSSVAQAREAQAKALKAAQEQFADQKRGARTLRAGDEYRRRKAQRTAALKAAKQRGNLREEQIRQREEKAIGHYSAEEKKAHEHTKLFMRQIDEGRDFESKAKQQRQKTAQEIKDYYKRDQQTARLEALKAQLAGKQSLYAKVSGKTAALKEEINALKLNLADSDRRSNEWAQATETQIRRDAEHLAQKQARERESLTTRQNRREPMDAAFEATRQAEQDRANAKTRDQGRGRERER